MAAVLLVLSALLSFTSHTCGQSSCHYSEYLCNGTCVSYSSTICNGIVECRNSTTGVAIDEGFFCMGCTSSTGFVNCFNSGDPSECAPSSAVCDGVSDCSTNTDEMICMSSGTTQMVIPPPSTTTETSTQSSTSPPVQCSFDQYLCGTMCLTYSATFCNGINDCLMDGVPIDELACTDCAVGFVNCQNQTSLECIPASAICNSVSDCSTNLDESSCGFNPTEASTQVNIPSPETTEAATQISTPSSVQCSLDQYLCVNTCLSYNATFCNGVDDCPMDGGAIDEFACTGCELGFVNCQNQGSVECIPVSAICNNVSDCSTNMDESSCGFSGNNVTMPSPSSFPCANSEYLCGLTCLPYSTFCDGIVDCTINGTTLDEDSNLCSGCSNGSFNCGTLGMAQCLSTSVFCDGVSDCPSGFDEFICAIPTNATTPTPPSSLCGSDEYLCASNTTFSCLSISATFCNGVSDCDTLVDGIPLDEAFCTENGTLSPPITTQQTPSSVSCSTGEYLCNGTCLSFPDTVCNGVVDCPIDNLDEGEACQGCNQGTYNCFQNRTIGLECLPTSTLCNGSSECSNGFDEMLCSLATLPPQTDPNTPTSETPIPISCSTGEYFCNGTCLPFLGTACNGVVDCPIDNVDEGEICQGCNQGFYNCFQNASIGFECRPTSTLCNGTSECSNGFDEILCSLATVPPETGNENVTVRPLSTSPTETTSQFTTQSTAQTQTTRKSTTHKTPTGLSPGVVAGISAAAALFGLIIILAVISLILYCTFKYKGPRYTKATSSSERNIYDNNNIMKSRVAPAALEGTMTEKPEHIDDTI